MADPKRALPACSQAPHGARTSGRLNWSVGLAVLVVVLALAVTRLNHGGEWSDSGEALSRTVAPAEARRPRPERATADPVDLRHDTDPARVPTTVHGRSERMEPPAEPLAESGIVVSVVDALDRPVPGLDVEFAQDRRRDLGRWHVLGTVTTDACGGTHFDPPALSGRSGRPAAEDVAARVQVPVTSVRVRVLVAVRPGEAERVVALPAASPIVLRLPPTGSVEVDLRDRSGAPFAGAASVHLRGRSAAGEAGRFSTPPLDALARDGRAVFERVGLGLDLTLTARASGSTFASWRGSGPSLPGRSTRVELWTDRRHPLVRLRALDELGVPLEGAEIVATVERASGSRIEDVAVVADAGSDRSLRVPDDAVRLYLLQVDSRWSPRVTLARAEVSLKEHLASAVPALGNTPLELGDVTFERVADASVEVPWLAGRLVDSDGAAIPEGVVVATARARGGPDGEADVSSLARSDAAGHFVLFGPPVQGPLLTRASAWGHVRDTREFPPGARGVEWSLESDAHVLVRVRLDEAIGATGGSGASLPAELRVRAFDGDHESMRVLLSDEVRLDGLRGGEVTVEVLAQPGNWPVARVEGVSATVAGERDPRLDPLDLRGRLTKLHLRLVDPAGEPLERVRADVAPQGLAPTGAWVKAGWLHVLLPAEVRSLSVTCGGYEPVEVDVREVARAGGERTLVCEPSGG